MVHHHFHSLSIDVLRAADIVALLNVREFIRETLFVQVLFTGVSLVQDDLVRHDDVVEAGLLARLLSF